MRQQEILHKLFRDGEPSPVNVVEWQIIAVLWKELQHLRKVVGDMPVNLDYYPPGQPPARLDDPA